MSNPGITGLDLRDLAAIEVYGKLVNEMVKQRPNTLHIEDLRFMANLAYNSADCLCEARLKKSKKEKSE